MDLHVRDTCVQHMCSHMALEQDLGRCSCLPVAVAWGGWLAPLLVFLVDFLRAPSLSPRTLCPVALAETVCEMAQKGTRHFSGKAWKLNKKLAPSSQH